MKTILHFSNSGNRRAAFTKMELLIIVTVIAMVGGLAASANRCAQNQVKIVECAANLRQFARTQLIYAEDYSDKLPTQRIPVGYSPWDLAWELGPIMNQYGTPWQVMYCPSTAPRFGAAQNAALYQYNPGMWHVLGYALTFPGGSSLTTTNINDTIVPQSISFGPTFLPAPSATTRVLIADATITEGNYTSVGGGFGPSDAHICPHLNGILPAGGNLAMLDGHVEWRPFSLMQTRTTGGKLTLGQPDFLW